MFRLQKLQKTGRESGVICDTLVRTRSFLAGLLLPLSVALITSAHAHTGAGVAIVGPVTYQSQPSPSPGLPLSEIVFLFAMFLSGIHLLLKLRQRPLVRLRSRLIGVSMIAILGLGVVAFAAPSHEVSVTPPVSFTFYFGGDSGYYSGSLLPSNSSNRLIQSDFFLALGDISYNGSSRGYPPTGNEADWCNFIKANVQNRLSNPYFPYIFITGNHDDGNPSTPQKDGYIEAFIANNCLPLSAFNSTATAGNGYINFVGSGLCSESSTCYGKEGYFDYPAANPIARIITITVADSVGNSTDPTANVNFNYCPLSVCGMSNLDMHWNWLTSVIADAKAAGHWIIVAFHKPCLSPDLATGCEGNGMPNGHNPNFQLESYLMSHGVDVLLNAHAHIYARSKQLTCLGSSEPPTGSTVGIKYDPTCVANDGSSSVYTRGKGTVEVIQGVFSQRDEQLNFSRPDINYFAKAMSARGSLTITPADCCWVNGSPMDMASGNGVGMMTVNATQVSFTWVPSVFSHNTQNTAKFSDSFVIRPQSNPTNNTSPPTKNTSPPVNWSLLLLTSVAAAIVAITVLTVLLVKRRTKTIASQGSHLFQAKMLRRGSLPRFEPRSISRLICSYSLHLRRQKVDEAYAQPLVHGPSDGTE